MAISSRTNPQTSADDPPPWWSAPAKLNLFLEVLGRRGDGFHEVDIVMTAIDVIDRVGVVPCDEPQVQCDCTWSDTFAKSRGRDVPLPGLPTSENNLVTRSLEAFRQRFGIANGYRATIEKNIPSGAGMGGASSDAATALVIAASDHARRSGRPIDWPELHRLAAIIGSDVPFFLPLASLCGTAADQDRVEAAINDVVVGNTAQGGNFSARCTGRGEHLNRVVDKLDYGILIVHPGVEVSTAEVYRRCQPPQDALDGGPMVRAMSEGDRTGFVKNAFNRLEQPAANVCPAIDEVKCWLAQFAPILVQMTGSGSACFAVFDSVSTARRCVENADQPPRPSWWIQVARPLAIDGPSTKASVGPSAM